MQQGPDGYQVRMVKTSSAEMIQTWNPGATVVKAFNTLGYFLIADPSAIDQPITVPIAADDRAAKEKVARIVAAMGLDPVDSGPLRFAHELEGMAMIYMLPLDQRRRENWEFSFRRTTHWNDIWEDEWSAPVHDADNLAKIPQLDE
jgi:predicted dinucleotide-binding enzyme